MDGRVPQEEAKAKVWHVVDSESSSVRRYIDVDYKSLEQAVQARADLLLHFGKYNPWRKRLCIRLPGGKLFNPEFEGIKG